MKRVVVGIISRKNERKEDVYLLVSSRRDFGRFTDYYYPPGGHVEEDEDDIACLIREIKDEVGIEVITARKIVETEGDVEGQITCWYFCDVKSHDIRRDEKELIDAQYFTRSDMSKINIWPATKKFFDEYVFNKN